MFSLKDKIFSLFGINSVHDDLFKVNGKGFLQRYNEKLAEDFDENELDKTHHFSNYLINPDSLLTRFIPLRYESMGGYDSVLASIGLREIPMRRVLKYIIPLYRKKGTKIGYIAMFRMIGIDGTILIDEYESDKGFDSPITWDDTVRRLDGSDSTCSDYGIQLFGTMAYSAALMNEIRSVVEFNEPINARLVRLTYNQVIIPEIGD